jgi:type IX secretion system PorP/SprF family membrane protein
LFFSHEIFAQQEVRSLPIQFGQFMRSSPLINPASAGSYSKMEVNTGTQRQGGNWNNIGTYYFNANIRLTKDRPVALMESEDEHTESDTLSQIDASEEFSQALPNSYHVAGFTLTNDKEGTFLNRTGIYGLYAWHTRISPAVLLSAGASIGVKNYSVDENYVNGGGSSFAPDGTIGVWLYNYNYNFGISVNQLFNSKLTPLHEVTRLVPNINITGSRTWNVNRFLSLKPSLLVRIAPQYAPDVNIYVGGLMQNVLSATIGYKYKRGGTAIIGLEKIRIGDSYFKMAFSYYFPIGSINQININTYEISLNYFLKPNRKSRNVIFQ